MRTSIVWFSCVLLTVGCGGRSGGSAGGGARDVWARAPAQPTCATAGEMVDARVGRDPTAPVTAHADAAAVTVERCGADAWSADAQACVSSPAMSFDLCVRMKLTPDQRTAYEGALAGLGCTLDSVLRSQVPPSEPPPICRLRAMALHRPKVADASSSRA